MQSPSADRPVLRSNQFHAKEDMLALATAFVGLFDW
jgi:hypothetical protein